MFVQRISCFSIVIALCAAAVMLIAEGTSALSHPSQKALPASSVVVDRTAKSDRLVRWSGSQGSTNAVTIELSVPSNVIVRDRWGNILFAVDHSSRVTTVGKQGGGRATVPEVPGEAQKPLPEGCEGAFSPYAEPSKAHILGRCLSLKVESKRAFS
jgi:hypothetical protein